MDPLMTIILIVLCVFYAVDVYLNRVVIKKMKKATENSTELKKQLDELVELSRQILKPTGYTIQRNGFFVDILKDGETVDSCATASTARSRIRELERNDK